MRRVGRQRSDEIGQADIRCCDAALTDVIGEGSAAKENGAEGWKNGDRECQRRDGFPHGPWPGTHLNCGRSRREDEAEKGAEERDEQGWHSSMGARMADKDLASDDGRGEQAQQEQISRDGRWISHGQAAEHAEQRDGEHQALEGEGAGHDLILGA